MGTFTTHQKTAGACEGFWAARVRLLYHQLALRCPGRDGSAGNIQTTRYAQGVAAGTSSEKKGEELVRRIWNRFCCDDQAQGIVSTLGLVFGKELPQLMDWVLHQWVTNVDYWEAISAIQPRDPTYGKPMAFIDWAATQRYHW